MILSGPEIGRNISDKRIVCDPFDECMVNPNSIDLTLSSTLLRYTSDVIDPAVDQEVERLTIGEDGIVLPGGSFHLGSSQEIIGSEEFVPLLHAKSSTARAGLFVHVTADLIDIGSIGTITFQMYSVLPIRVYAGMRIAQMSFWRPKGRIELYHGKYQGSRGPRKSLIHMDPMWSADDRAETEVAADGHPV